jgi:hypothetical protein
MKTGTALRPESAENFRGSKIDRKQSKTREEMNKNNKVSKVSKVSRLDEKMLVMGEKMTRRQYLQILRDQQS